MNERIKLLAEQAGITLFGDAVYMSNRDDTLDVNVMKKFAELIVRECAGLFNPEDTDSCYPPASVREMIEEHFGVEE